MSTQPASNRPKQRTGKAGAAAPTTVSAVKLQALIEAEKEKMAVLQQENAELWQGIIRPPRLPSELLAAIIECARGSKSTLYRFSLVCKSCMHIARGILFPEISVDTNRDLTPILNHRHCTVFPHVQVVKFTGDPCRPAPNPRWLKDFIIHLPKFCRLTKLALQSMSEIQDFEAIDRGLPLASKKNIQELEFGWTENITMSAFAAFISQFPNLTVLTICWVTLEHDKNETLVPPPSSIKKLFIEGVPEDTLTLTWFTDLHHGVLDSFSTRTMGLLEAATSRPFIRRFGANLSEIELEMSKDPGDVERFFNPRDFTVLREFKALKHIEIGSCIEDLDKLSEMLAELPQSIQEIGVRLRERHCFYINHAFHSRGRLTASCSHFDRTLAGTALPSLRKLTIEIPLQYIHMRVDSLQIFPCCAQTQNFTINVKL
ncbi:hypothetical protein K438DRAFT_2006626 [Mycena galopus ATCC 62051]|nr:hypothetical protein K438DRAFT_2006626 [Mycena galopus ATCC 62051]